MRVDILNLNQELENKKYPEVTSSNIISYKSSEPDPQGLASYELFGRPGTQERKTTFGWINLYEKFLHPHCFYVLRRLQKNITECIFGEAEFYVWKGKLIKLKKGEEKPVNAKSGTGLKFLYNIWDELNWKPEKGQAQLTFIHRQFLHLLKKEEIFIDKMIVIPPFFRDIDMHNNRPHVLNVLYKRLITNASSLKQASVLFEVFGTTTAHKRIQETLNEIYENFLNIIGGTKGYIHKHLMGKSTDYSARCVISNARYDTEESGTNEVSFDRSAVPLATAIKAGAPFIVYGVRKIVERILSGSKFVWTKTEKGVVERTELADNYLDVISSDHINNLIDLYYSSYEHRLDLFLLPAKNGQKVPLYFSLDQNSQEGTLITSTTENVENIMLDKIIKPMNLTELFYLASYDTIRDKIVYVTRFPVEDQHNIYPSLMNVIPCNRVKKVVINGVVYPRFPITFDSDMNDLNHLFTDTLRLFPSNLPALGGDFDGDMVSIQMIFTNEANEAAKKYIYSKMNILNVANGTMRSFLDVSSWCIYGLTYKNEKKIS
jgi:hypothetical protein